MKVNITSKNGITLKTAEKYVAEDIAVGLSTADANNLTAANIKKGVTILGVTGTSNEGINPSGNINITGTSAVDVTNYATATVSDSDLVASNIKSGVNILGITGTHVGGISGVSYEAGPYGGKDLGINGTYLPTDTTGMYISNYKKGLTITDGSNVDLNLVNGTINATNLNAANIAKGVTILGKTGTYDSSIPGITSATSGTTTTVTVDGTNLPTSTTNFTMNQYAGNINVRGNSNIEGSAVNLLVGPYASATITRAGTSSVNAENLSVENIAKGVNILGKVGTYTSDANAVAGNILSGKTAYVNGVKVTGNIASLGATTYTPSTSNQTIASGKYLSGTQTIKGDSNLIPANIKNGVSIFGVTGTMAGGSTKYRHHIKCNIDDYYGGWMEFDIINSTSTAYTDINGICDALERAGFGDYVNYTVASGYVDVWGTKYIISAIGGAWGMFYEKLRTTPESTSYTSADIMTISNIVDTVTTV